jgi:formylmethanofuran dehydrogenase subunit B
LACDDLRLDGAAIDTRGCPKAAAGFAPGAAAGPHRVEGRAISLAEALDAAAAILRRSRAPLFTGLGTDLAGIRALLALAERAGAVVDRWRSGAQFAALGTVQRAGAFTATFGEIANRADLVLLLGRDPTRDYPRLLERLVANAAPLYRAGAPAVMHLGPGDARPEAMPLALQAAVEAPALLDAIAALAALVGGLSLGAAAKRSLPLEAIGALAERLKAARYGAIIWDPAGFAEGQAEAAAMLLLRLLRALNRKTRAVGLALGGSDNAQGVAQAMLWQAGWPGRLSYGAGIPEHDPWRHDAERLVEAGEVDALLWVAAISRAAPPATELPLIALLAPGIELARPAAVEIRVGIPGLDHGGTVLRADTVIAIPLAATRPSEAPSVARVAAGILERMAAAP